MDPTIDQFALPEEERRRLLLSNLMMGLGAGLLDSRGKNMWPAISSGLLGGLQMGNQAVANAQQGMAAKFKLQSAAKAQQEAEALNKSLAALDTNPQAGMASRSGSVADAAAIPQQWEIAMQKANIAANAGDEKRAEQYRKAAEFYRSKYNATPHIGIDPTTKQPYQFILDEQGNEKRLNAMPRPDLAEVDLGGTKQFVDKLTTAPGTSFAKTMTPEGESSREIGRGNLAVARGHLRLAGEANRRAAEAAANPKPQFDSTTGQFVYPPTAANPTGAAVKPEGYQAKPPEHTRRELDSIDAQLGIVGGAKSAASEVPSAFGMTRGAATLAGTTAESVAGRFDNEKERAARAYVYNVVSAVINERAGAAQSVQELARLRSFLPGELDNAKQIQDKLSAFETYLKDKRKAYSGAGTAAPASSGWTATRVN